MKFAMIGLGRMGGNMVKRLLRGGHEVVVWNRSPQPVEEAVKEGAIAAVDIDDLISKLEPPRVTWVMLPAGDVTEDMINTLASKLSPGDIIIDGGNSNYKESIRRGAALQPKGFHFVDVGTSGGVWGLTEGYSLMIGGSNEAVSHIRPLLETLAPGADFGWGHVGPTGSGHFVKMVHNGIEYGMMQAFAEGFEIMRAKEEFNLDMHQIAELWRFGSVVRSWLLDLTAAALKENPNMDGIKGWVADSGEGRWTVFEAIDQDVPAPVITLSLLMRFASRQDDSYAAKLLASMRNQFGGHAIKKE
ncbi:MAG: decarboxylating 6-phosphogluconate dehydrogenase [Anaerolineae bacterium]|mgnify:CR=1 FL=1|nr:decarboxylating 6-phosphogluconate dehydrogenase [Anaerolineae bacterium]